MARGPAGQAGAPPSRCLCEARPPAAVAVLRGAEGRAANKKAALALPRAAGTGPVRRPAGGTPRRVNWGRPVHRDAGEGMTGPGAAAERRTASGGSAVPDYLPAGGGALCVCLSVCRRWEGVCPAGDARLCVCLSVCRRWEGVRPAGDAAVCRRWEGVGPAGDARHSTARRRSTRHGAAGARISDAEVDLRASRR